MKRVLSPSQKPGTVGFLVLFVMASWALGVSQVPGLYAEVLSTNSAESQTQSAKIVDLEGDVRILKKDSAEWQAAKKDQIIEAGDQIITGKTSFVDISYDHYLLNITRIQENTKAEFRTIQPTDIYLEDGSIFSALDGLDEKGGYQIATPIAVAGVRGTHFDVAYDPSSQKFSAASLPSGEEGHTSRIFVSDPRHPKTAPVEIIENKQLDLKSGEPIHADRVRPAESRRIQAGKIAFQHMAERMPQFQQQREQGKIHFQERRQKQREQIQQQQQQEGPHPKNSQNQQPFRRQNHPDKNGFQRPGNHSHQPGRPQRVRSHGAQGSSQPRPGLQQSKRRNGPNGGHAPQKKKL